MKLKLPESFLTLGELIEKLEIVRDVMGPNLPVVMDSCNRNGINPVVTRTIVRTANRDRRVVSLEVQSQSAPLRFDEFEED